MNKIIIGEYEFSDSQIQNAKVTLANAMVSESLSADTFNFTIFVKEGGGALRTVLGEYYLTSDGRRYVAKNTDISSIKYGAKVEYYKNSELQGKFYVDTVTRIGKTMYEFNCVSAVGLLIRITHQGGVYENATHTTGELIREIFDKINFVEGTDYTIDTECDIAVNGWLPYSNCRDNLRQILFAIGASIVKSDDGNYITIKYISSPTLLTIPDERIYMGGKVNYLAPA